MFLEAGRECEQESQVILSIQLYIKRHDRVMTMPFFWEGGVQLFTKRDQFISSVHSDARGCKKVCVNGHNRVNKITLRSLRDQKQRPRRSNRHPA